MSHGQIILVESLLEDLRNYCDSKFEVLLTLNILEQLEFDIGSFPFSIRVIRNIHPKGFSENHNTAFAMSSGKYFCILNPDIRLIGNTFPPLIACFGESKVGVVAPLVINSDGELEDSARSFPTPFSIMKKAFKYKIKGHQKNSVTDNPDWVGGMFMFFDSSVFRAIGGFDEHYFLYYEDVDLCARMTLNGYEVHLCSETRVVHEAQRKSHKDPKYLYWHLSSMLRFFMSKVFIKILFR